MKRLISLALAFLMLFSLTACNTAPFDTQVPPADDDVIPKNNDSKNSSDSDSSKIEPLVNVLHPEMSPYPEETGDMDWEKYSEMEDAWRTARKVQRNFEGRGEGVNGFIRSSLKEILISEESENFIYSPINVYMALGMLAELTGGNSRQQIVDLLGEDSIEAVRESAKAVWNNNYCDDGALTSIMAGSVWADKSITVKTETAQNLADTYYSELYNCEVGSPEMVEAYKAWLNKNTGNLLKEAVEKTEIDPQTILMLATTIYFRAKWDAEFNAANNTTETFHTAEGDIECEFMHQSGSGMYYYGEGFGAINRQFNNGGSMWLILPDEDSSVNELINNDVVYELAVNYGENFESSHIIINQSIPKFDVNSDLSLNEKLQNLGVTDVFNAQTADFSNLSDTANGVWLDKVKHVARVKIDEEGCEAAAYTEMALCGAAMPPKEEIDFVLDRPFIFAITGVTGDVLFVGVVNDPVA